ncbi:hypothetical protein [Curtobacterium sp. MCBD17_008]|uniref:hypothetical protein n=1 Tax=Curtobacterium sp. MCBD17_008 TaxID=2175656 RepID=UPI000DA73D4E|nr:hypothetical protein [Curtobacterium sp. MCBD17_008]PZE94194.1 hypothetical protein DEI95_06095 [Curtobacterium sp. MCBD17_008]
MSSNSQDGTPAPYGDRRPAATDGGRAAPWRGRALGLLVVALASFLGAAVALVVMVVRVWTTLAQDTGVDIATGLVVIVFLALVLSGCAMTSAALAERRR